MDMKSVTVLAVSIVIGFLALGVCQRYAVVAPSGNPQLIFLVDKATGRVWMKLANDRATNWERVDPTQ